jgi:hypothetical protein
MKKYLLSCLISLLVLLSLIIGIYYYSISTNKIEIEEKSFSVRELKSELDFPNANIPSFLLEANNEDILYQAYVMTNFGAECTYVCIIRTDNISIKLENKLPFNNKYQNKLNSILQFNKIENTFNPVINLPENRETESGIHIKVFNPNFKQKLNLISGSYQYATKNIDKEGYYNEIIIFDKKSNLVYYERNRFHAFQ